MTPQIEETKYNEITDHRIEMLEEQVKELNIKIDLLVRQLRLEFYEGK